MNDSGAWWTIWHRVDMIENTVRQIDRRVEKLEDKPQPSSWTAERIREGMMLMAIGAWLSSMLVTGDPAGALLIIKTLLSKGAG